MKTIFVQMSSNPMRENPARYNSVIKTLQGLGFDAKSAAGHGYYGMAAVMVTNTTVSKVNNALEQKAFYFELVIK